MKNDAVFDLITAIINPASPEMVDAAMNHDLTHPEYARLYCAAVAELVPAKPAPMGRAP